MKVVNLTKIYKVKKGEPVKALDGVTFDLPQKGMVFLTGKSGSGKTTLLNLLSGLDTFDDGDIILGDKSLKGFSGKEADSYRNGCCGFVFQDYNLLPEFTVAENVSLALEIQGKQASKEEISQALKSVDLEGYENRKVTELSGGQKQRIAIVRALVKNPEVIFADEPTGALDSKTGDDILSLLKKLSEQKLVVIVSHEQEFAQKYADRIIELKDGKILSDTAAEYCENDGAENKKTRSLVKSKLPVKAAIKIGAGNFKMNKLRFVVIVILAVLSFSLLGSCCTLALFDDDKAFVDYIYDSDIEWFTLNKNIKYAPLYFDDILFILPKYRYEKTLAKLTNKDIELIQSKTNDSAIPITFDYIGSIPSHWVASPQEMYEAARRGLIYSDRVSGFAVLTEEFMEEMGYSFFVGRLPQNSNEVAIPWTVYNGFTYKGFKDKNGVVHPIEKPEDILGLRIELSNRFGGSQNDDYDAYCKTITGVIYAPDKWGGKVNSCDCKAFVSKDCLKEYDYVMVKKSENKKEFKNFAYFFRNYSEPVDRPFEAGGHTITKGDYIFVTEENDFFVLFNSSVLTAAGYSIIFAIFSVAAYVVSFGFMLKAIGETINNKSKQIGILRAMGMNFGGLFMIFMANALSAVLPIFGLSVVGTSVANALLNRFLTSGLGAAKPFPLWQFHILTYVFILSACLITAVLGCLFPLLKAVKQSPADTIRKGQRN